MTHLRCTPFEIGSLAPAIYYAEQLKTAFREVCFAYQPRQHVSLADLEPLWHLVETLATARLFGVHRPLYDQVDKQVSKMNRGMLIKLALRCFLTPSLRLYLRALCSGHVPAQEAVLLHLHLLATRDWMSDNTILVEQPTAGLDELLEHFRAVVDAHSVALSQLSKQQPELRALWRSIISRANRAFLTPDYTDFLT